MDNGKASSSFYRTCAYKRPLLNIGLSKSAPPHTVLRLSLPATFLRSSVQRAGGRPTLRLLIRYSRTRLPQRPSVLSYDRHDPPTATSCLNVGVTLVLLGISSLPILSRRETPNIARSIARCVTLNLWIRSTVSVLVSAPYVITGRTNSLKTFVSRHWGIGESKT
ncbi:jg15500 [Pararge aegeria aegeria]|uniref:Jg15500 protein n=1 Tax=Pararge aegeria aegeria TaxID=348720 RepID=A0A8S4R7X1_9NEOP|nr:jg15500 [Pararge aegeria aegeria]